jgi:hypothetical protein
MRISFKLGLLFSTYFVLALSTTTPDADTEAAIEPSNEVHSSNEIMLTYVP